MPGWFIVAAVALIGFGFFHAWKKKQQLVSDAQQPLRSVSAKLTKKIAYGQSKRDNVEQLFEKHNRKTPGPFYFYFTPLEGGETRKFEVESAQYPQLEEGVEGELELQGSRLIRFSNADLGLEFNDKL